MGGGASVGPNTALTGCQGIFYFDWNKSLIALSNGSVMCFLAGTKADRLKHVFIIVRALRSGVIGEADLGGLRKSHGETLKEGTVGPPVGLRGQELGRTGTGSEKREVEALIGLKVQF